MRDKKRYKHLDILEIPLSPYLDLFSYAMFIDWGIIIKDVDHINPFRWIIYNYFSKIKVDKIDKIDFSNYLCNPLYFFWNSSLLEGWRVVGKKSLDEIFACQSMSGV